MKNVEVFVDDLLDSIDHEAIREYNDTLPEEEKKLRKQLVDAIIKGRRLTEDKVISLNEAIQILYSICEACAVIAILSDIEDDNEKLDYMASIMTEIFYNEDGLNSPKINYVPDFIKGNIRRTLLEVIVPSMTEYLYNKSK